MVDTKKIVPAMTSIGTNVGGAMIGYAAIKSAPDKFGKFTGLALFAVGIMAHMSKNKTVKELGQGVAVMGAIDAIDQWMPQSLKDKAPNFIPALGNVDYGYSSYEMLPQTNDVIQSEEDAVSFENGLNLARQNEGINGVGYVADEQENTQINIAV
ncbi:hypothetical protein [Aureibacter tunicatorum]|uniref:Uncharacterized protein n=1 Tax=Aureibacter tunicatorum TaxID=866807 RepID=A0AAE3XNV9_9BACT|nr:hypothetical protein [Aureibacter tunicatorum]MDR6239945.1 hypothetical protein [Aureibacter tunicatorum]BDD04419.1 hypothetical protein AUTU_19020 [Aureibacter tunicatorum]